MRRKDYSKGDFHAGAGDSGCSDSFPGDGTWLCLCAVHVKRLKLHAAEGADHTGIRFCGSAPSLPFKLCGRGYGLCSGGGTDPGNVRGQTLQPGNGSVCRMIYGYDGAGCGAGINENAIHRNKKFQPIDWNL